MMTSQLSNQTDTQNFEMDASNLYSVQNIRVLRRNGYYGIIQPRVISIPGTQAQTAANFTTPFFIADRTYKIIQVTERHETAGTDAGAVTVMLKKVPSGTAPASGTDTLSAGISLKTTANTNQTFTSLTSTKINQDTSSRLVSGDALSLVTTGTLTNLVGVTVSVLLKAI